MKLIEQYKKSKKEIATLKNDLSLLREATNKKESHITYDVYRKKIRALEDERDNEVEKLEDSYKKAEQRMKIREEKLNIPIAEVGRIITFLKTKPKPVEIKNNAVSARDRSYKEYFFKWIDDFYTDDYFVIRACIAENDKPKNINPNLSLSAEKYIAIK
ncbi:MAG: hypothetical protein KJ941_07560 [Bacteroidetes bacterium]|nr:hypothetical protein [Bacteroidota bacterium]